MSSPAVDGTCIQLSRSFPFVIPITTGTLGTVLAPGGYALSVTVDTWFKMSGVATAVTAPATVAAEGSQPAVNGTVFVTAGIPSFFDVPLGSVWKFSVLAVGGSAGVGYISGPYVHGTAI